MHCVNFQTLSLMLLPRSIRESKKSWREQRSNFMRLSSCKKRSLKIIWDARLWLRNSHDRSRKSIASRSTLMKSSDRSSYRKPAIRYWIWAENLKWITWRERGPYCEKLNRLTGLIVVRWQLRNFSLSDSHLVWAISASRKSNRLLKGKTCLAMTLCSSRFHLHSNHNSSLQ